MSACERSRVKISTSGSSGAAASGADHPTRAVSGSTRCAAPCTSGRRVPAGRHRRPPAWTGPARLSDAAASPPERHAPEPAVITAMGQNLDIRVFTGVVPSIELLVQLLSTSK